MRLWSACLAFYYTLRRGNPLIISRRDVNFTPASYQRHHIEHQLVRAAAISAREAKSARRRVKLARITLYGE